MDELFPKSVLVTQDSGTI